MISDKAMKTLMSNTDAERTEIERNRLVKLIVELSLELETEIKHRYGPSINHPAMKQRYERDMELVYEARQALRDIGYDI